MGAGTNQLAPVCMVGPRTLERLNDSKRLLSHGSGDQRLRISFNVGPRTLKRLNDSKRFLSHESDDQPTCWFHLQVRRTRMIKSVSTPTIEMILFNFFDEFSRVIESFVLLFCKVPNHRGCTFNPFIMELPVFEHPSS